jgi:hypothetical protein
LRGATGTALVTFSAILLPQTFANRDLPDIEDETIPVCAINRDRKSKASTVLIEGDPVNFYDLDSAIGREVEESLLALIRASDLDGIPVTHLLNAVSA